MSAVGGGTLLRSKARQERWAPEGVPGRGCRPWRGVRSPPPGCPRPPDQSLCPETPFALFGERLTCDRRPSGPRAAPGPPAAAFGRLRPRRPPTFLSPSCPLSRGAVVLGAAQSVPAVGCHSRGFSGIPSSTCPGLVWLGTYMVDPPPATTTTRRLHGSPVPRAPEPWDFSPCQQLAGPAFGHLLLCPRDGQTWAIPRPLRYRDMRGFRPSSGATVSEAPRSRSACPGHGTVGGGWCVGGGHLCPLRAAPRCWACSILPPQTEGGQSRGPRFNARTPCLKTHGWPVCMPKEKGLLAWPTPTPGPFDQ